MPTLTQPANFRDIDAILWGWQWDVNQPNGHTRLTFSFPTGPQFYPYQAGLGGFETFNAAQQGAARKALANYDAVSNLDLVFTTDHANANLRLAEVTTINYLDGKGTHFPGISQNPNRTSAEGNPPDPSEVPGYAQGDCWFNHTSYNTPTRGSFAYGAGILHEIGHALGLKHGHITQGVKDANGNVLFTNPALAPSHDSQEFSIMTYRTFIGSNPNTNFSDEYPSTLMQDDILAVQWMYGPNYNHNSTNTTYVWNNATGEMSINGIRQGGTFHNKVLMTIWDGGGTDAYNFANFTTKVTVNLSPGGWSTPDTAMRADLDSSAAFHFARGCIANALVFANDFHGYIENAYGGSNNDSITGNIRNNLLIGNSGNDVLNGVSGDDRLFGSNGNDRLTGGTGRDQLTGGAGIDAFIFNAPADSGTNSNTRDQIFDFNHGEKIDIRAIDANINLAGNQSFSFVVNFAGRAGQLQWDRISANSFVVSGDVNGDGVADFSIQIKGVSSLLGSDFNF